MKVVFLTSEIHPFSKTGGLGDVSYSLPINLKKNLIDIIVITPFYKSIKTGNCSIIPLNKSIKVFIDNRWIIGEIFFSEINNLKVYFIKSELFNIDDYYSGDTGLRFGFFCYASLELLKAINFSPNIIHLNDWQTAILPVLLKINYSHENFFKNVKTILTIHNLAYQGYFDKEILNRLRLPDFLFNPEYLEFYNQVNFLKAGIIFSDYITTVSPSYAKEILEPIAGWGLDGVLRTRKDTLVGILNGIDDNIWNPEKDNYIFKNYNYKTINLKKENKKYLQNQLGFDLRDDIILFGFVGRLTYQKGFELVVAVIDELMKLNVQLVILGKGEEYYENLILEKYKKYKSKISLNLKFDEKFAHQIYAGIDFLIMPSVYEPCGLTQMISLKYGTIPIARKTGGLKDSINDISEGDGKATGILFNDYNLEEFQHSLVKASELYYLKPDFLKKMQIKGMKTDFSWDKSSKEYINLYKKVLGG